MNTVGFKTRAAPLPSVGAHVKVSAPRTPPRTGVVLSVSSGGWVVVKPYPHDSNPFAVNCAAFSIEEVSPR